MKAEAPLRETLAARLKREGYAVDCAADGDEGLYLGREMPFDVAVIDLGLPKRPGMELVKALRDGGQRYPILDPAISAFELAGTRWKASRPAPTTTSSKPFHVEELLARLNALVRRATGWTKPVLRIAVR